MACSGPSSPCGLRRAPRFVLRASHGCATRSPKGEAWWSQAGWNRRPRHCERRALPAELWPRRRRLDVKDGGQQSAPFTIRAKVKSRTAKWPVSGPFAGTSLVCDGWNRYLAGSRIRDPNPRVSSVMRAILEVILIVLDLYVWLVIAPALLPVLIDVNVQSD